MWQHMIQTLPLSTLQVKLLPIQVGAIYNNITSARAKYHAQPQNGPRMPQLHQW